MASSMATDYKAKVILGWTTLHFAEETESWESVETLLNGGSSTRDLVTTKRKLKDPLLAPSIMKELCRRKCLKLLRFALEENPDLVKMRLEMSRTLLHVAAQSGSSAVVRCLMDYPVDLNASDGRGVTPLHEVAAHCDAHVLMKLIKAGADAHAKDIDGRTSLHYAASGGSASSIRILLSEGLAPDVESANGCAPLHEAASSSNPQCIELLLNAGADLNMTTNAGWTALHWAANKGTHRSVRILLEAGIPVECKTQQGETPLHLAAERGHSDMVSLLVVGHGADVEAVDSDGRTPAKRAEERLQRQKREEEEEAAAAAASATAAVAKKEVAEKTKKRIRNRKRDNSSQMAVAAAASEETDLQTSPQSEELQGDYTYDDEVEGSEYSYQSESEISGQRYSDTGTDFDEEYQVENAAGGTPTGGKPQPLLAIDTHLAQPNHGRGNAYRGKNRGRGRPFVRGHKSGSRGGGRGQSQEYIPHHAKAPFAGNVEHEGHQPHHRYRHHQAKEGEARREYNSKGSAGDTRRKEHVSYTAGEDTRKKHPFSKDRQKQTIGDGQVNQPVVPTTRMGNLERLQVYGSTDQVNRGKTDHVIRQESRSGGTFLDELRYLQEKLAVVGAEINQPPKAKQNQHGNPKPGF